MPKASLRFDLIEEQEEFKDALNGGKYKAIIEAIDNRLRSEWKYENKTVTNIEELRQFISNELREE